MTKITRYLNKNITGEYDFKGVGSHVYALSLLKELLTESNYDKLDSIVIDKFKDDIND